MAAPRITGTLILDEATKGHPAFLHAFQKGGVMVHQHWACSSWALQLEWLHQYLSSGFGCSSSKAELMYHFLAADHSDDQNCIKFSLIHALIYGIRFSTRAFITNYLIDVFISCAKSLGNESIFLHSLLKFQYRTEPDT